MDIAVKLSFEDTIAMHDKVPLTRTRLRDLQVNLGYLCNQACEHCHVEAGPKRTEIMTWDTMQRVIQWAQQNAISAADLTGGAPEMNPHFRPFVDALLGLGIKVTSRCNLTILTEPGYTDLPEWYAKRNVHIVSSLPCYTESNVDAQRGKGVYARSIEALETLNALGYGVDEALTLDLVYNPGGAFLPGDQIQLEADYKNRLFDNYGIRFSSLITITNLPINRFKRYLKNVNQLDEYMMLLRSSFNSDTVDSLMCRHLISVGWQGHVYDCDFNQMLGLGLGASNLQPPLLWDIDASSLDQQAVAVGSHCFGCTAGAGSSCGGALT